jgi:hypothetical protein
LTTALLLSIAFVLFAVWLGVAIASRAAQLRAERADVARLSRLLSQETQAVAEMLRAAESLAATVRQGREQLGKQSARRLEHGGTAKGARWAAIGRRDDSSGGISASASLGAEWSLATVPLLPSSWRYLDALPMEFGYQHDDAGLPLGDPSAAQSLLAGHLAHQCETWDLLEAWDLLVACQKAISGLGYRLDLGHHSGSGDTMTLVGHLFELSDLPGGWRGAHDSAPGKDHPRLSAHQVWRTHRPAKDHEVVL